MQPLYALGTLALSILDDVLVVLYLNRVRDSDILSACLLSMAVGSVQVGGLYFVFKDSMEYALPLILGNGIGTALAIYLDKRWFGKKPRDKKTGRFKPTVDTTPFQLGEVK
jgi:hypothetical protein